MQLEKFKQLYNSKYGVCVKILTSLALLYLFFHAIDTANLLNLLRQIDSTDVIVLFLLTVIRNVSGAMRFHILIKSAKIHIGLYEINKQYFIASFFNNFLPTAIGGDAIRFAMLVKKDVAKTQAGAMIILERLFGFYALICIALFSSLFWNVPKEILFFVIAIFIAYTIALTLVTTDYVSFGLDDRFKVLKTIKESILHYNNNHGTYFQVFCHSIIFQLISIGTAYYTALAFGVMSSIIPFLTLVPLVWFCSMIPIGFGGLGPREISFAYLFSLIGFTNEASLLISLGFYLTIIMSGVIGALYFVSNQRNKEEALF